MTASAIARDEHVFSVGPFDVHAGLWRGGDRGRMLLLHGLGGNSITWSQAAALLAARMQCLAVAIDYPGFGPSHPRGQRLSVTRMIDISRAIMDQVDRTERAQGDAQPWTILGNSMGGVFGLQLARRWPDRVRAVVLASTALPVTWGRTPRQLASLARYVPLLVPHLGRRLIARYNRRTGLPGVVDDPIRALFFEPSALDDSIRQQLLDVSAGRMNWVDEASRAYEEITRDLGRTLATARAFTGITRPVQAIHGQADPLIPVAALDRLRQIYPDWMYIFLSDVGHVPQMEAPARFAACASEFLLSLPD